jgi:hypothetical protein
MKLCIFADKGGVSAFTDSVKSILDGEISQMLTEVTKTPS